MLYFGKILDYNDKGYGFIEGSCLSLTNATSKKHFFHISSLKGLGITESLIKDPNIIIWLWYNIENNKKGQALSQAWLNYNEIDEGEVMKNLPFLHYRSSNHDIRVGIQDCYEIMHYVQIYKEKSCTEQAEANNIISQERIWDEFPHIRSLNDHTIHLNVPGILPVYYAIVCKLLNIKGGRGLPLTNFRQY